jgi:hypothetical protein
VLAGEQRQLASSVGWEVRDGVRVELLHDEQQFFFSF